MNKQEYLEKLAGCLKKYFSKKEVEDILRDYAEYFEEGRRQNKTDSEIAAKLGDPVIIAEQIVEENRLGEDEFKETVKKKIKLGGEKLGGLGKFFKTVVIVVLILALIPFEVALLIFAGAILFTVLCCGVSLLILPISLVFLSLCGFVVTSMAFYFVSIPIGFLCLFGSIAAAASGICITGLLLMLIKFVWDIFKKFFFWTGRKIKLQLKSEKEAANNELD